MAFGKGMYRTPNRVRGHVLGPKRRPGGQNGWVHRRCRRCGIDFQWPVKREWERAVGSTVAAVRGFTLPDEVAFRSYLTERDVPECNDIVVKLVHDY